MHTPSSVLVVGASLGGLSVAEALRREGYAGSLVLLGAERHLPYDRPPLSKKVLAGEWEPTKAELRSAAALEKLHVQLALDEPAVRLVSILKITELPAFSWSGINLFNLLICRQ